MGVTERIPSGFFENSRDGNSWAPKNGLINWNIGEGFHFAWKNSYIDPSLMGGKEFSIELRKVVILSLRGTLKRGAKKRRKMKSHGLFELVSKEITFRLEILYQFWEICPPSPPSHSVFF